MEMLFKPFGDAVAKQFAKMPSHQLYRVYIGPDDLWNTYLGSFPEGSNPMFKARTEHDWRQVKNSSRSTAIEWIRIFIDTERRVNVSGQ